MKMDRHEVKVVSIRLVEELPLYSKETITSAEDVLQVLGKELQQYDRVDYVDLHIILLMRSE